MVSRFRYGISVGMLFIVGARATRLVKHEVDDEEEELDQERIEYPPAGASSEDVALKGAKVTV